MTRVKTKSHVIWLVKLSFVTLIDYFVTLEIVFTITAPAFDTLFIGCVLNTKIAEKLTFEAFY